jgi:ribose-phosphate pyrophosphokinase
VQGPLDLYTLRANRPLAEAIAATLDRPLGALEIIDFPNENIFVRIGDNARERDVFLIAPLDRPVNGSIMELLISVDAFKRASAGRITAVIPHYAYGRSDKKDQPRVPITARLLADLLETAGVHRVLTLDLHAAQIQGFFRVPVDELSAMPLLAEEIRLQGTDKLTVVTDLGFARRARELAESLGAPLAIVEKRREGNGAENSARVLRVIGDVAGRRVLIVDDEVDTAGTLVEIARAVADAGALEVRAAATHGVLSPGALERIAASPIQELLLTDSLAAREGEAAARIRRISIAPLFAAAIERIHDGRSVGALFGR